MFSDFKVKVVDSGECALLGKINDESRLLVFSNEFMEDNFDDNWGDDWLDIIKSQDIENAEFVRVQGWLVGQADILPKSFEFEIHDDISHSIPSCVVRDSYHKLATT